LSRRKKNPGKTANIGLEKGRKAESVVKNAYARWASQGKLAISRSSTSHANSCRNVEKTGDAWRCMEKHRLARTARMKRGEKGGGGRQRPGSIP